VVERADIVMKSSDFPLGAGHETAKQPSCQELWSVISTDPPLEKDEILVGNRLHGTHQPRKVGSYANGDKIIAELV
jgi:hypothetical protein